MSMSQAGHDQHSKYAGVDGVPNDPIWTAPNEFVMLEHACLQTPLFAEGTNGCRDENQRREDDQKDDRVDEILRVPVHRQKGRERFAHRQPSNYKRQRLNENCNDGTPIRSSRFVARSPGSEEKNCRQDDETHAHKVQRPKVKPVRHCLIFKQAFNQALTCESTRMETNGKMNSWLRA